MCYTYLLYTCIIDLKTDQSSDSNNRLEHVIADNRYMSCTYYFVQCCQPC